MNGIRLEAVHQELRRGFQLLDSAFGNGRVSDLAALSNDVFEANKALADMIFEETQGEIPCGYLRFAEIVVKPEETIETPEQLAEGVGTIGLNPDLEPGVSGTPIDDEEDDELPSEPMHE